MRKRLQLAGRPPLNAYFEPEAPISALQGSHSCNFGHGALGDIGSPRFRWFLHQHHRRVGELCRLVARTHGLGRSRSEIIARAGALHDIGKLFVPEAILQRPGPLTDDERDLVQKHSIWGSIILGRSDDPIMHLAAAVALQHHECYDGTGYPLGLKKDEICIEARIVTVCDVYDALRARRPYKEGLSHEGAMNVLVSGDERVSPTMFDPDVLKTFASIQEQCRTMFDLSSDRQLWQSPLA